MTNTSDHYSSASESLQAWRESLLTLFLRGGAVLGLAAMVVNLLSGAMDIFLPINIGLYAGILALLILPLPYSYRALLFLPLVYGFGLRSLLTTGVAGNASVILIALIVVTGLLFSARAAIGMGALVALTCAAAGWLTLTGRWLAANQNSAGEWLIGALGILIVSGVIMAAITFLQERYHQIEKSRRTADEELDGLQLEKAALEKSDAAHALELRRKTNQLKAASEVARQVIEIRDVATLLQNTVRLAAEKFEFYHVGMFLVDEDGRFAVLQAASSDGGRQMLDNGYRMEVGAQGIVGNVASTGKPRVALDVGADAVYFNNPNLPRTLSEMALPLLVRNRVIGVLDIQSDQPNAFQQEDIDIMQTLADQLAVAIENARLFSNTQTVISQLEAVTFSQTREAWQKYLTQRTLAYRYTPLGVKPILEGVVGESPGESHREFPVILHGEKIGVLRMRRKQTAPGWTQREEELIQEITKQLALAVNNSRLMEDTNRRIAEEQTLGAITSRLGQTLDFDTLLQTAAQELGQLQDVAEISVFVGQPPEDQKPLQKTGRLRGIP